MPAQNTSSTVPRILKQKPACEKCFVCDGDIETVGFPLIVTSTLSSKTSLPNKIGKLMGDGFMVIVSMDDVICKRCSSLFNHMDRLETDLERVQNTLSGYLKVKYKISDDDIEKPPAKMLKMEQNEDLNNILEASNNASVEVESQLSNMFGSPVKVSQKDDRTRTVRLYKCASCNFKTTDLQQFQPHYEKCSKKNVKSKESEHVSLKTLEAQGAAPKVDIKKFSCNICNFKINDKQAYEEHMKKHVNLRPFKCRVCSQRFENREQATTHARTHQPDYFKCGICNLPFPKREALVKHLETHETAKTNIITVSTSTPSTNSTQKLLQASIEEALRDTANEAEVPAKTIDSKGIEFYSCQTCSLTFLQESIYTQHMKQHRGDGKKIGQSLIRQDVRTNNTSILNTQSTELRDGDLESIFEKMHSEKTEVPVVVTTTANNTLEQVTFNISIPQDVDALDPEQQITASTIRKHENVLIFKCETCNEAYGDNDHLKLHYVTSGHGPSHSPPMPIDMPNLDEPEAESSKKSDSDATAPENVEKPATPETNSSQNTSDKPAEAMPLEEEHRSESNTDPVPMEVENMNPEQPESGEIKLMLDSDNQLITSDGQILQLDNHVLTDADGNQIITSSDGQILTVQGADNEQLQQLLQSVGVVVQQEGGEEEQMQMQLDGSQVIIVQTDEGEVI